MHAFFACVQGFHVAGKGFRWGSARRTLLRVLVMDTAVVPRRERLDFVVDALSDAASATSFTPATDHNAVRLKMSVWDLGGVGIFDTECSAHTLVRSQRPSSDEAPELLLTYALMGHGAHSQASHEVAVRESVFWPTYLPASPPSHHRHPDADREDPA